MDEQEKNLPEGEEKPKHQWQIIKESWYDKIPLTLKQLDIIIGVCITALVVVFGMICLDAMGIIG